MLVLTRRAGESIVIDGQIVVTVLDVRGDVVRVGIDAPREIQVHRAEVHQAVQEAARAAAVVHADTADTAEALGTRLRDRPDARAVDGR